MDLFCGAGGLSRGFQDAGFEVALALDSDPVACAVYAANHPATRVLCDGIERIDWGSVAKGLGGAVDLVIGGPSCQGFSTHGKRDPNDPRNFLFKHFVNVVKTLRPSWVVMENVKGLLTYGKGKYRKQIESSFHAIGYEVRSRVLMAADYGVPQRRERMFFLATNTGKPIDFPAPTHSDPSTAFVLGLKPWVTVGDAIGDLPLLGLEGEAGSYAHDPLADYQRMMRLGSKGVTLHRARRISELAMRLVRQIPQGKGLRHIPEHRLPERFRRMRTVSGGKLRRDCTTLYYRLAETRPAYTVTCYFTNVSSGPFVHPRENRAITAREAARLQSFPDRFDFGRRGVTRLIGNAVPPLLAKAVASHLLGKMSKAGPRRYAVGA